MSLDRDLKKLEEKLIKISTKEYDRANYSALNKTGARIKTQVVRQVAARTGIKNKYLNKKVFASKAALKNNFIRIRHYREGVPVISLNAKQTKQGVRALKTMHQGAFIADGSKGTGKGILNRAQVLRRLGSARNPLEVVKKPIKDDVDNVFPRVTKVVFEREYPKLLQHELTWRINKLLGN